MKMMKMFVLMLLFLVLGAAGMKAQVVIGGTPSSTPDGSALLDLNAGGANSSKGLLLPLVAINSAKDKSCIVNQQPQDGLLVCNTTGTLPHGVYYWSGGENGSWVLYIKF
jgi:hypothetical protein